MAHISLFYAVCRRPLGQMEYPQHFSHPWDLGERIVVAFFWKCKYLLPLGVPKIGIPHEYR